jgi:HlyD family secretion protein
MKKIVIPIALILALLGMFVLTSSLQQSTSYFYGITENKEQSVSFQNPVVVTDIKVIEGQIVEKGTILLAAKRGELSVEQDKFNSQLDALNARQYEAKAKLNAEIKVLRVQRKADVDQVGVQIQQLQTKNQLNKKLFESITGSAPVRTSGADPAQQQLSALRIKRKSIYRSFQAKIDSLQAQLKASKQPAFVQKKQIKKRLNEVNRQAEELTIRADFSGRIGSINTKPGEKIPAFQSILTVHGLYPKTAKGYILETVANDVHIGQTLWLSSTNGHKTVVIKGEVESLGNRIVEYPDRLKKNQAIKSWGREVNIRLPANNTLLLGEKVQISFSLPSDKGLTFFRKLKEQGFVNPLNNQNAKAD